jgi:hypothetical protein
MKTNRQMLNKKDNTPVSFLLLLAVTVAVSYAALQGRDIFSKERKTKSIRESVLYLARPDSNSIEMFIADHNTLPQEIAAKLTDVNSPGAAKLNLIVVTHGWYEKTTWPKDLALAIKSKVNSKKWLCGWYDWRQQAKRLNPTDAAELGRDIVGPLLGKKIANLSENWGHIHLIGHSAGAWVISEAAKIIAKETNATIHLTFLDAYIPPFWHEKELGDFTDDPNVVYWADHYFTRDLTLRATERRLTHAYNINLTDVNPGFNDHEFPRYWYHATVIGRYGAGQRYEGKELFNTSEGVKYGFPRALEAGQQNWQANTAIKHGNEPVKIKRAKKSIKLYLKERFKRRPQ